MIVALDPSKRCTGLVIYDPNMDMVRQVDTYRWEKVAKQEGVHNEKYQMVKEQVFVRTYAEWLSYHISAPAIHTVVSELPHGSQNASAARSIGAVTGAIAALGQEKHGGLYFYLEGTVKEYAFKARSVGKNEVINLMFPHWEQRQGGFDKLLKKCNITTQPQREAIADALLVLNYHFINQEQTV